MTLAPSIKARTTLQPYTKEAFANSMAALGPFEACPHIALGASGGADSTALLVLLADWVRGMRGTLSVFTVDHGLRPEAGAEAEEVAKLCASVGASHNTLLWKGRKPTSGIQEAARAGRYRLLEEACHKEGILHLALAHQQDDQAETFLLRLERGSGLAGLSGMAPVRFLSGLRVIRPLLDVKGEVLRSFLKKEGYSWIEDPSNSDRRFARVRARSFLREADDSGFQSEKLTNACRALACYRREIEREVAQILARSLRLYTWGSAVLERNRFLDSSEAAQLKTLGQILTSLSGHIYPPRGEALKNLAARMTDEAFAGATLAGLKIEGSMSGFSFYRETRGLATVPIAADGVIRWDNRFDVSLTSVDTLTSSRSYKVAPLGIEGWRHCKEALDLKGEDFYDIDVAPRVRGGIQRLAATLPALWDNLGLLSQPHLGYDRKDRSGGAIFQAHFRPEKPITRLFTLV